jgi:hypothetical protein
MYKVTKFDYVPTENLVEWRDNPVKRGQVSIKSLQESIESNGIASPLAVIKKNGMYLVIDGNRRLRVARTLSIPKLPANLYAPDVDPLLLAITLNADTAKWDQQTVAQLLANHPHLIDSLPARYVSRVKPIMELLGDEFTEFIQKYSPNSYIWGIKAANYVGRHDDLKFKRLAVMWCGKHKQINTIRRATDAGTPPSVIEDAVRKDKPLKFIFTT